MPLPRQKGIPVPATTHMAQVVHQRMTELLTPEKMARTEVADIEGLLGD